MSKVFLIALCLLTASASLNGQIFTQVINEAELMSRVKLIDEFFMRFNNEIDASGTPVNANEVDSLKRWKNLACLLNLERFAIDNNNLDSISSGFIDHIIRDSVAIHYEDTTWHAVAYGNCIYEGKTLPISLKLKTEQVERSIYRWAIGDVECPIFNCMNDSVNPSIRIFPGAHGSGFITLTEFINMNTENVSALFYHGYTPSSLSVFEYMIKTKRMKLKNITTVKYEFHTCGYNFTVEQFTRPGTYNNGWLISSISKCTN